MEQPKRLVILTAEIAANFVANNHVGASEIGEAIAAIHSALAGLGVASTEPPVMEVATPAVSVRKSLADPAKIISMIDGKPYSTLKRHLTSHGLTPAEYRTRYHLPADYPMIAPAYLERRKAIAQKIGLGLKSAARRKLGVVTPSGNAASPVMKAPRKPRALGSKATTERVSPESKG
jgi:predicted transcriptional regulator